MKILFVSSSSGSRGGGEIFLFYLAEALKAEGHEVLLWASRHPRMDELSQQFGAIGHVQRADYRNTYDTWHRGLLTLRSPSTERNLRQSWLETKPDLVHLNKQNLEDGSDILAAATGLSIPHLCTVHITQSARFLGARFSWWRDIKSRRDLRAYRRTLVAVAPIRAAQLSAFIGIPADVRTVLNGVPLSSPTQESVAELRTREGLRPDSLAIVAVGRLEPQKRPLEFLRLAEEIRAVLPDVQMNWIGSGRMTPEWDREMATRNLGATVRRIDWRRDVRAALPAYDLMLHPAAFEGLALSLLEAMEAGVPCAVSSAVHRELPAALQSCTLAIAAGTDWKSFLDRSRLREIGARAREVVRRDFSTAAMGREYLKLYRELCQRT